MKIKKLKNEYLINLGHRIKLVRTYLKYDQKMLAEFLSTVPSQISKIESGKSAPTLYYLLRVVPNVFVLAPLYRYVVEPVFRFGSKWTRYRTALGSYKKFQRGKVQFKSKPKDEHEGKQWDTMALSSRGREELMYYVDLTEEEEQDLIYLGIKINIKN